uniref:Putative uracil-dna degrading factor n=1 Tax=Lutzomyia longipalpis TaxID=7200 RepID=A0A1B0CHC2_LUTLO
MSSEESGFGFKDKQKALDTLKLLENQDSQYRLLTIRGLLGRAKRVLTLTKAEEKRNNIKEAIEVFENWLEENKSTTSKSKAKSSGGENEEKIDKVPGLGFKDKEAAEKTLKILDNRDADYQKLVLKSLITSSKSVISRTKDKQKVSDIKEGVDILTEYLDSLDTLGQPNMKYLPADIIQNFPKPSDKLAKEFLVTYTETAGGNYKKLRTLFPEDDDSNSWDIVRNKNLSSLQKTIQEKKLSLFNSDGSPTKEHLALISWAYTPKMEKLKQFIEQKNEKNGDSASSDEPSAKKRKV